MRIRLVPPLGYLDFLRLMSEAKIVLTDSGGIQEATTTLGVPCITLRDSRKGRLPLSLVLTLWWVPIQKRLAGNLTENTVTDRNRTGSRATGMEMPPNE
jgi:UDP-N-acetylglucosamine 2-epimerase